MDYPGNTLSPRPSTEVHSLNVMNSIPNVFNWYAYNYKQHCFHHNNSELVVFQTLMIKWIRRTCLASLTDHSIAGQITFNHLTEVSPSQHSETVMGYAICWFAWCQASEQAE